MTAARYRPVGQGEAFARVLAQASRLCLHHGLLITGGPGLGKSTAADFIANALLCTGAAAEGPCGACPACLHIDNHPDLKRVTIPEDRDEIPVDLVRELKAELQRLPVEGRARVVIVDPADRLNPQGQNAMLKTLEEPGRSTFLLLPTRRPESLLETVRSRVGELRMVPLAEEDLQCALRTRLEAEGRKVDEDQFAFATSHAEGSFGLAQDLLGEEFLPLFALLEGFLTGGQGTPIRVSRAALEGASGRIETLEKARWVLWTTRTILRKELLTILAQDPAGPYVAATSVRWTTKIESLFDAEADLSLRIPPEQVLAHALAEVTAP